MNKDINICVLTASGRLTSFRKNILKSAKNSLKIIKYKIPVNNVDIVFYDNPYGAIPHLGIGAHTLNPHLVCISLDPDFSHFEKTIKEETARTLAHELHHCIRWQNHSSMYATLLDAMITEGLADHFDIEITNKKPQAWDTALASKQYNRLSIKAEREYRNKNYNHYEWFFGSKRKSIPKWTGYTIGFNIVGEYLKKHPDKKPSQLYAVQTEGFIK